MRYGMLLSTLAAAGLFVGGCNNSLPKVPDSPSTPAAPSTPASPSTPAAPSAPTPKTPATPNTPNAPSTPSAPSTPNAPGTPSSPSTPNTSNAPSSPTTPNAPNAPSAPSTPSSSEATSKVKDAAASKPADKTPIKADLSKIKFTAEAAELFGWDDGESRAFFFSNGLGEVVVKVPDDGDYEIVISASCQAAKGENAKFKLKVDGTQVGAETQLKAEDAKDYAFTATLKAGDRKIGTEFTNDMYKEGEYDMNFYLHGVKVVRK